MTFQEYHLQTRRTLPHLDTVYGIHPAGIDHNGNDVPANTGLPMDLLETVHMVLGMVSEVDELSNAQDKGDIINIQEELVDILWYASNYALLRKIDISGYAFPRRGLASLEDIALTISKLSDYGKKYLAYKRIPNRDNEVRDYFKLLDTLGEFASIYKINLEQGFQNNIDKLKARFPLKFDMHLAQEENRDLDKERKELEK